MKSSFCSFSFHTDELLPARGCRFDEILDDIKAKILPNLVRPMSTNYMAHLHSAVLLESQMGRFLTDVYELTRKLDPSRPVNTVSGF